MNQKTLARWLIDKTNTEKYRAGQLSGWKHPKITAEEKQAMGGRQAFLTQVRYLEKETEAGKAGRLTFDWINVNTDVTAVHYEVSIIPELCLLEQIEDPRAYQLKRIDTVRSWRAQVEDCSWAGQYYEDLLRSLVAGKVVKDAEDENIFKCLNAVVRQTEPIWERTFSSRVFPHSKVFQKTYRAKLLSILRNYSPYRYVGMIELADIAAEERNEEEKCIWEAELLDMHNIHSYAQTLEWKGALVYQLTDAENTMHTIDTSPQRYGVILNTQALQHAHPLSLNGCKKIMTIENKANYESMLYREDTLYIYCHGFFTPKELRFLRELAKVVPEECEFLHWGDMDFGGINIFLYMRKHIFPEIQPCKMGTDDFYRAIEQGAGIPLKESTREKLLRKDADILEPLKRAILETDRTIEQEYLL